MDRVLMTIVNNARWIFGGIVLAIILFFTVRQINLRVNLRDSRFNEMAEDLRKIRGILESAFPQSTQGDGQA